MDTHRTTARIVGALFLIAMVTSLVGGIWLESIIAPPDTLDNVAAKQTEVVLGVLLELLNGLSVIGIAVLLFPLLKQQDDYTLFTHIRLFQCRYPGLVLVIDVCSRQQQRRNHPLVTRGRRLHQRGIAQLIHRVGVSPRTQQGPQGAQVAVKGRQDQDRAAGAVLGVGIDPLGEQILNHLGVACSHRRHQPLRSVGRQTAQWKN